MVAREQLFPTLLLGLQENLGRAIYLMSAILSDDMSRHDEVSESAPAQESPRPRQLGFSDWSPLLFVS